MTLKSAGKDNIEPDQMLNSVVSDLGQHCLLRQLCFNPTLCNPFMSSGLFYYNSFDWSISDCRVSG